MLLQHDYILFGPNRRSERTVVELWLQAEPGELAAIEAAGATLPQRARNELTRRGIAFDEDALPRDRSSAALERFARLAGAIALALQRQTGHRVDFLAAGPAASKRPGGACWLAVEYEHDEAGEWACRLALQWLAELVPGIGWKEALVEDYRGFDQQWQGYRQQSPTWVLPRDAQAIIDAAARLDVPCVKLEREPYAGVEGDFRIRPNGLLKLGQACHQRVVDGTFPIDSGPNLARLLNSREAVCRAFDTLGLPRPGDGGGGVQVSARHVERLAERIGFPVTLRPRTRSRLRPMPPLGPLPDAAAVRAAAHSLLAERPGVMVEAWVEGRSYKLVVADGELLAVVALERSVGASDVTADCHAETRALACRAARTLGSGLLTFTVVSPDIARPLDDVGVCVDLDVAPALDRWLPESLPFAGSLLDRAAEGLLRHLFPPGSPSRIPVVAVTGTNGKTTTTTLIARVMQAMGLITGSATTTGVFIDRQQLQAGDCAGGDFHHRILESPDVQCAVLETARGAVTEVGLMFDRCDVAVCTNVSPDHLGQRGIETVADMAELKAMITLRARDAVVLNADDEYSLAMLPRCGKRQPWLVSQTQTARQLRAAHGPMVNLCVAEPVDGQEWLCLYRGAEREPLMRVAEVPITLEGSARFNVSNVMQAIAACTQLGAPAATLRSVLGNFQPAWEDSPGRQNLHRGPRFSVLFDKAHNEEGHRYIAELVQGFEVPGRRILCFAASAAWRDDDILRLAKVVAGSYDFYVCRDYPRQFDRQPNEAGALLAEGLRQCGVPPAAVRHAPGDDYLERSLALCREGDLLVYALTNVKLEQEWATITSWPGNAVPES